MGSLSEPSLSQQPLQIRKGYADTSYGQIHYRRCGEGPPAVLLLHAAAASSAMFASALPRLAARGLAAAALDLPNCGESYAGAGEPRLPDLANALLEAAQQIGFPPAFYVVGHQAGASMAIHLAAQFPELVKKLVLWGVPVMSVMKRGDVLREEPPDYKGDFFGVIQSFIAERFPDEDYPWQLKVRGLVDMLQSGERRPWTTRPMALCDHEGLLRQIRQPTLCLAGDLEPLQKATMKAALLLSNGKYHNLGPAGCDVADEFPAEYVQAVAEFLKVPGVPLERSSCTIPEDKKPDPPRRASAHATAPPEELLASPASSPSAGDFGADLAERRNSESEGRSFTEKRRTTLKSLLKGKF